MPKEKSHPPKVIDGDDDAAPWSPTVPNTEPYTSPPPPNQDTSPPSDKNPSSDDFVPKGSSLSLDAGPSEQRPTTAQGMNRPTPVQGTKKAPSRDTNGSTPATEASSPLYGG